MNSQENRRICLVRRPEGMIDPGVFALETAAVPALGADQVLIKNRFLSLDPAMRGWVSDRKSYIEPVPVGGVMRGGTISEVVASNCPDYAPGDIVRAMGGWQDYAAVTAKELMGTIPPDLPLPLTNHLSVLGITGLTAYFGLVEVGQPKEGETVVVSTAAGAVGSIVGQIAKIKGCRVVGITGSDAKCRWILEECGYDAAINYKTEDVGEALRTACPKGVDIYFDNVGGEILNTVLGQIRRRARVVICGAITQYNNTAPAPGPSNYLQLLVQSARMEGFIILNYMDRFMEGAMQLAQWVLSGQIKHREEIVAGLENAPAALMKLFDGSNTGKLIIQID